MTDAARAARVESVTRWFGTWRERSRRPASLATGSPDFVRHVGNWRCQLGDAAGRRWEVREVFS